MKLDLTLLPRGRRLSDDLFAARHRMLLMLLWAHVPLLGLVGVVAGNGLTHMAVDLLPIALLAALGMRLTHRTTRSVVVSFGLLYCSADLSHLVHNTSMHFHFFVVLGFIAVYQDWRPYLLSIGFVLVHHAGLGLVMPQEVFGDAASIRQPVLWALVHAAFVAAASVAQVTFWKFAETAQDLAAQADRRAAAEAEASAATRAVEQAELAQTRAAQLAERQALARHVDEQVRVLSDASSSVNDSVQSVAAIVEQMTANIRAIATHVTDATDAARTAERRADATNVEIAQLGERSEQIGRVITLISSIAAQTHLLALNATIEAARAGESGRGFAVVANEVKELAHESAGAAQDIAEMVSAIQDGTRGAAHGMREIGQVVARIGDLQAVITSAVEEHTATTSEISRKLGSAAAGTEAIAASIAELAETSDTPRR
jgi:hypothetical protein